jgi:DNA-binding XRE family transcriptional regulator
MPVPPGLFLSYAPIILDILPFICILRYILDNIMIGKRLSCRLATMLTVLYIGDKLREVRKRTLLTQQELADKSGVGVTTIVRIERNQVEPHARTIRKLAAGLGVDPKELL